MTKLTKWGNSIGGLRLAKAIIEGAGLRVGDEVSCRLLDNGTILLIPLQPTEKTQRHTVGSADAMKVMKW